VAIENRDLVSAYDRLAKLENRVESMERETIRCVEWQKRKANEIQDLREARERAAMDILLANARQDTLERRLERFRQDTVEKLESLVTMTNEIAAELQALHVAQEQASSDLVSANDRQASVESRTQAIEKLMKEQAEALQTVAEQVASDFVLTDYRQARLVTRMETIETLTKEQMAATASLEILFEVKKVTKEQIDKLQTATEQEARETVWSFLCLENRVTSLENLMGAQTELPALQTVEGFTWVSGVF